ncbi:MAG: LytTR family DNA-binding domain-containing protein [Paludibacter sp.]|nr:LytTR family DNA-binding domain-containing protein [Paludibacter sp.]
MDKITTVIVDDESKARDAIKNMLSLYCPDTELVGEADGVETGVELIRRVKPQLVILDIKMQDGDGFDLLKRVKDEKFYVVFVTAFDEFAIKAFKFNAIDYLLKPVDVDDLIKTIEKVKLYCKSNLNDISLLLNMINELKKDTKKIVLKTTDSIYVVKIEDVIRCESSGNYTYFYLKDEKPLLVSRTLKEFDSMLHDYSFLRVHQSHLVNVEYIKRYVKSDGGMLIMKDDKIVPVAMRKKDELLKVLGLL